MPINYALLSGIKFPSRETIRVFQKKTGNVLVSPLATIGWLESSLDSQRVHVFLSPRDNVTWITRDAFEEEKRFLLQKSRVFASRKGCRLALEFDGTDGHLHVTSSNRRIPVRFTREEGWKPYLRSRKDTL